MRKNPKNYDGNQATSHRVDELLSGVLGKIADRYQDHPDLILAAWPSIVGEKLAPMAEAVSFQEGTLFVRVKNSTLYSLLIHKEKERLLMALKRKFPKIEIKAVHFRMG